MSLFTAATRAASRAHAASSALEALPTALLASLPSSSSRSFSSAYSGAGARSSPTSTTSTALISPQHRHARVRCYSQPPPSAPPNNAVKNKVTGRMSDKVLKRKRAAQLASLKETRSLKAQLKRETAPDPVLGYRPGNKRQPGVNDEALWEGCELRRVILDRDEVWGLREDRRGNLVPVAATEEELAKRIGRAEDVAQAKEHGGPIYLNFGLGEEQRELLFKQLPQVMTKDRLLLSLAASGAGAGADADGAVSDPLASDGGQVSAKVEKELSAIEKQEAENADRLARILDLRNASAKAIQIENRRRILKHFGDGVNSGSVETQVALITYRLHVIHSHLHSTSTRHDHASRHRMRLLAHQRAKLLRYLKRQSASRYYALLRRVGVHPRAVEGEVVVPGMPKLQPLQESIARMEAREKLRRKEG